MWKGGKEKRDQAIEYSDGEWEAFKCSFLDLHRLFQEDTILPKSIHTQAHIIRLLVWHFLKC